MAGIDLFELIYNELYFSNKAFIFTGDKVKAKSKIK